MVRFSTLVTAIGFLMDSGKLSLLDEGEGEGDSSLKVSDSSSETSLSSSSSIIRWRLFFSGSEGGGCRFVDMTCGWLITRKILGEDVGGVCLAPEIEPVAPSQI